ncbi:MAG: hypothetical protein ACLFPL_01890 [Candidatus Nanoarchaeia archaeon]
MVLNIKTTTIPSPKIHLLICINSRTNSEMPHCSVHFNYVHFKELKKWIIEKKLLLQVKITATHCLGMCTKEGAICLVYPKQEYYTFNTIEDLKELVYLYLEK